MQSNDFITPKEIASDVLMFVGDTGLRYGLSLGWYVSQVQQAVERFALDMFFQVITADFSFPSQKLQDPLPKNCFNIRELYLWNGSCCTPENSVIVHYKRLYNNKPGGTGYTANRKENDNQAIDPFYQPYLRGITTFDGQGTLYYANIQNGLIMFSSNCASYSNYRIVYNGLGGEIGDEPIIPRMLRDAVIDFVTERAMRAMMAKEPRTYRILWADAHERLYNRQTGTYWEAMRRVATLDTWMKERYNEYSNRGNW